MKGSTTDHLVEFIQAARSASLPDSARARVVDALVDCIGCAFAGSREPLARKLLKVVSRVPDTRPGAILIGTGEKGAPAESALYNGAAAHALDYDDTNHPGYAHPSAVILPACLAVAELGPMTGRDLVTAYIAGLEVLGRFGRALNMQHYKAGWHATSTLGGLAATASVAVLLRLGEPETRNAIGLAASGAGGLRANFGSMTKPLHAGSAARNGVLSCLLAREGFTAAQDALDHPLGFFAVFNAGRHTERTALRSWGNPWEILGPYALALKAFPSCGATHPAIEAALRVKEKLRDTQIRSVRLGISQIGAEPLIHAIPEKPLEGKFSLPFCVAAALCDGEVTLASFSEEKIRDPRIRDLMQRISIEVDGRVAQSTEFAAVVTVEGEDGFFDEAMVPLALGKPSRWFDRRRLWEKFRDCAGRALSFPEVERVFAMALRLDSDMPLAGFSRELLAASASRKPDLEGSGQRSRA